ncbi:hypothetical protein BH10BAC4_BH10BAC4_20730 [soil metagenome]
MTLSTSASHRQSQLKSQGYRHRMNEATGVFKGILLNSLFINEHSNEGMHWSPENFLKFEKKAMEKFIRQSAQQPRISIQSHSRE